MKDIVVVLSNADCDGKPSRESIDRIDYATSLIQNKRIKNIMLCSESVCMAEYVLSRGVDSKSLFIQPYSRDTIGEAVFSKEIVDKNKWKNIAILSSDYHIKYRACIIFDKVYTGYHLDYIEMPTDKINNLSVISNQLESLRLFYENFYNEKSIDKSTLIEKHKLYGSMKK